MADGITPSGSTTGPGRSESRLGRGRLWLGVTICLVLLYAAVFIARPYVLVPREYRPLWRTPSNWVFRGIDRTVEAIGLQGFNRDIRSVTYLVLMSGIVPLIVTWSLRRKLRDVGTRRPNQFGVRIIMVSVVMSLPFLIWMVNSPSIAQTYVSEWKRNTAAVFLTAYALNMLTEHFLIQGVVLGFCHASGRWPAEPFELANNIRPSNYFVRLQRWLGFANPIDRTRPTAPLAQWLGLPSGCLAAMITSAFVFGLIHVGKDLRECILSFPGGLALAYIAYRTDSWLTPFFIHAITAGIAFLMMMAGTN